MNLLTKLWGDLNNNSCIWPHGQSIQMPKYFHWGKRDDHRLLNSTNTEAFCLSSSLIFFSFDQCHWNVLRILRLRWTMWGTEELESYNDVNSDDDNKNSYHVCQLFVYLTSFLLHSRKSTSALLRTALLIHSNN